MVILREFPRNSGLFGLVSYNVFWPSSGQRLKNKYRGFLLRPLCKQRQLLVPFIPMIPIPFHSLSSKGQGPKVLLSHLNFWTKKNMWTRKLKISQIHFYPHFLYGYWTPKVFNQGGCRSTGLWPFGRAYLDVERFSTFGVLPGRHTGTQLAGRVDMDGYGWLVWLVILISPEFKWNTTFGVEGIVFPHLSGEGC